VRPYFVSRPGTQINGYTSTSAWLVAKDLSKLQTHEIEAYIGEPYKRSGDLLTGYQIALDPTKWEQERQASLLEAEEEIANDEIDQLATEDEDGEASTKSKKRKRESDAPSATKIKSKQKAKSGSIEPITKRKLAGSKAKKGGSKSKNVVESEDGENDNPDTDGHARPRKNALQPPAKKAKKDKKDKDGDDEADCRSLSSSYQLCIGSG